MIVLASVLLCVLVAEPSSQQAGVAAIEHSVTTPSVTTAPATVAPAVPSPQSEQAKQEQKPDAAEEKPPTPKHTGFRALLVGVKDDVTHLPSRENLYIASIGGALAAGMHPLDQTVNARILNQYDLVNDLFVPGKYFGDTPEQMALSIGAWVAGRLMDKPKLSHLGMDLLRAQAVTEIMVEPLKFAVGRERPDGSNHQSFPSGHAAITFAAAAVIERHLGWRNSIVAYAVASYVAASRLHDNRHYLSDVIFGAAVGTIAGRTVTTHGRDMWTLFPMAVPGGVAIGATRDFDVRRCFTCAAAGTP